MYTSLERSGPVLITTNKTIIKHWNVNSTRNPFPYCHDLNDHVYVVFFSSNEMTGSSRRRSQWFLLFWQMLGAEPKMLLSIISVYFSFDTVVVRIYSGQKKKKVNVSGVANTFFPTQTKLFWLQIGSHSPIIEQNANAFNRRKNISHLPGR